MGTDVVTQKQAWRVYETLLRDDRVTFLHEPPGTEDKWRLLTQGASPSTNTWTDAYLAAFASVRDLKVVSFDGDFKKISGANTLIL